jgi:hypothetical protein
MRQWRTGKFIRPYQMFENIFSGNKKKKKSGAENRETQQSNKQ